MLSEEEEGEQEEGDEDRTMEGEAGGGGERPPVLALLWWQRGQGLSVEGRAALLHPLWRQRCPHGLDPSVVRLQWSRLPWTHRVGRGSPASSTRHVGQ